MDALRFWTREIWGRRWDAERRAKLIRHYWSYARHPAVPPVHVPEDESGAGPQQAYVEAYLDRVQHVQSHAASRRGVRLTFRPIGKNLRLLGTAIRRDVDDGVATFIEPDGPADEIAALASQRRSWHPWLWSRTGDQAADLRLMRDAAAAWSEWFAQPGHDHGARARTALPRLPERAGGFDRRQLARVLKLAAATRYAFRPLDRIEDAVARCKQSLGWPAAGVPVLGLHVRRSDAASSEIEGPSRSNRPSFALDAYLAAADRLCEARRIRHIFIASESEQEIARARALRPQYVFLALPHDRGLFPDISQSKQFIEHAALNDPGRARPLAMSAILDLALFRDCNAFVGAFNSEFSMLAWLLTIGSRQQIVPYVSLSRPAPAFSWHPPDALLNIRNNCPLELYHW